MDIYVTVYSRHRMWVCIHVCSCKYWNLITNTFEKSHSVISVCVFSISTYKTCVPMIMPKKDANSSKYLAKSCLWQPSVVASLKLVPMTASSTHPSGFLPKKVRGEKKTSAHREQNNRSLWTENCVRFGHQETAVFYFGDLLCTYRRTWKRMNAHILITQ